MLRSCRIEDSETCWRAQAAAQLSRTPNDAVAFSAQVTPFVEAEVTRSRTSSWTVVRTSACDFGVGDCAAEGDGAHCEEEPKTPRLNQDEDEGGVAA